MIVNQGVSLNLRLSDKVGREKRMGEKNDRSKALVHDE